MAKSKKIIRKYRKSRYSPNIQEFSSDIEVNSGIHGFNTTLCTNPTQTTLGVSQQYTVKNFEINFVFESTDTNSRNVVEDICAYIMFKPQGMIVENSYNLEHPEYILAYKYIGSPTYDLSGYDQPFEPIRIKTRMARKLNTGDSIILFIKCKNEQNFSVNLGIHGVIRWWSKAN